MRRVQKVLESVFTGYKFFAGKDPVFQVELTEGHPDSNVAVIVGSNASGKSLAIRVLIAELKRDKPQTETIAVSMRHRATAGMHQAFMFSPFGEESDSTGANSMHAIEGALRTARGRKTPCWVAFDEPDIGMSEDFAYALGQRLAQQVNEGLGKHCGGLVLVTHSKELVNGLRDALSLMPHGAYMANVGESTMTLDEWLQSKRRRTVEELLGLIGKSNDTNRAVAKYLKD